MTTISRHTFTAETDLGTVLSLKKNTGSITLDSGAFTHVEAALTLALEDAALLDELDPRDSRRVTIGATRDGHVQTNYTPWVEQARNRFTNPAVSGTATTGWSVIAEAGGTAAVSNVAGITPPVGVPAVREVRATWSVAPTSGFPALTLPRIPVEVGEVLPYRFYARRSNAGVLRLRLTFLRADGVTAASAAVILQTSPALGAAAWFEFAGSTPAIPATTAFIRFEVAPPSGQLPSATHWYGATWAAAGTPSAFDGATNPGGELERTRWLGTANASASVIETRSITGQEWVPEGFRYFDLGIREASPDRAAGTVTLRLASDEAILLDYAQLVDGVGAWDVQGSLRAVCNYVLDKIGAALEPGTVDADATAYWSVTNLHPNPLPTSALGYAGGAGAGVPGYNAAQQRIDWTSTASDSNLIAASSLTSYRVTPGKSYVFAIEWAAGTSGRTARPAIQWRNNGSASTLETIRGPVFSYSTLFQRMHVIATAPEGAEFAYPLVLTSGNSAATLHVVKRAQFYEGDKLVPFYTGATAADAHYTYKWADPDAPNASSSIRTPVIERRPESLFWPAGVAGMTFLEPLLKVSGLRLVCDEQRRWWLRDAEYRADGSQNYRHAVNIKQATESLSRDDESWFDAAVYTYVWRDDAGIEYRRVDSFALNDPPTKVLRVELRDTPYPGPGRAEAIVRRAQGRGRTITATAIPTWTEVPDQPLAVLLEGTPIQTGTAEKITYDLGAVTVTATSRTTDTPAAAWILIPAGERWIDSPVGESWTEEII